MSDDDNSRNSRASHWENTSYPWKRVVAWVVGKLLIAVGGLAIILGLMTIALSNMDDTPVQDLISGTVTIGVGFLMLYFGFKIIKKARGK